MILKYYLEGITLVGTISNQSRYFSTALATGKSDRINALRKQYDSFLEEDKRRKERNEYIVGRLDKMRYCTAMVPLRHKPTLFIDRRDTFSTSSSLTQLNKSSLDIPRHFDETSLLQEISKKYILIPKIRPSIENDNISTQTLKPAFEENCDWKSKYEILDQLKKGEKESDASSFIREHSHHNDYNNVQKYDTKRYDEKINPSTLVYKYEQPEKDKVQKTSTEVQNQFETKNEHEAHSQIKEKHLLTENPQNYTSTENILPQNNIEFNNNREQLETHAPFHNQTEPTTTFYPEAVPIEENMDHGIPNHLITQYDEQVDPAMYNKQEESPVDENKVVDTEKVYPEDIQTIEVIHPDDLVKEINSIIPNATLQSIETENDTFPIQTVNVQDFTPSNEVRLQDGVNINPEGYPVEFANAYAVENVASTYEHNPSTGLVEHIEDTADNSGIEAFNEEQRDMFYSETTNENYGYNQESIAEGYEQQLPVQGTDYSQSETAVYYDGYDAEQAYPVEISEHEETNQRYDPHYEQQYVPNYTQEYSQEGYEQQVYTNDPQYDGGNLNQIQEGLEQFQFEQQHEYETVEKIEQELDTEQGFNEQIVMSNIEKPIEDLQAQNKPETPTPKT